MPNDLLILLRGIHRLHSEIRNVTDAPTELLDRYANLLNCLLTIENLDRLIKLVGERNDDVNCGGL
jgi:hypothetical protein